MTDENKMVRSPGIHWPSRLSQQYFCKMLVELTRPFFLPSPYILGVIVAVMGARLELLLENVSELRLSFPVARFSLKSFSRKHVVSVDLPLYRLAVDYNEFLLVIMNSCF
jgi:hypothetical protein